jgi:acetyl esterase/lipase
MRRQRENLLAIPVSPPISRPMAIDKDAAPPTLGRVGRRVLALGGLGAAISACSPLKVLNGLAPGRRVAQSLPYGTGPRRTLDVYSPARRDPAPIVVFFYGGSWDSGAKEMYRFVGGALATRGCVTVIPDYRVYPEVRYPDFLEDCAAAFAWAATHGHAYGGAGSPFLMGHSAGAYNAAMLTLHTDYLAKVGAPVPAGMIGLAGPYDFLPLHDAELEQIFGANPTPPATQPINHVDGRNPPMLLLAGTKDTDVLPRNTTRLAARIRAAGGPVADRLYPGVDHREIIGAIGQPFRFLAPTLRDSLAFIAAPASVAHRTT